MSCHGKPPGRTGATAHPDRRAAYSALPGGEDTGTRQFGTGRKARVAAMRAADELRGHGIAAAAIFKPSMGGWIVQTYPGGIRRPP